jgi:uncharacterized protein YecT (DUF1311 family)
MVSSSTRAAAVVLAVITVNSVSGKGQSPAIQPGAAANREYAAVFAHSDDPCSANAATAPYVECMGNELRFVEAHLDAFVEGLRGISGSPEELAGLNQTDTAWRAYRENACVLPYKRFRGGTIAGPMWAECRLSLDRAYMKQLSGTYILSQFPK